MYRTVIRRMTLAIIALVFFHLGYTQAMGAPVRIEDVAIMELEGRSRLTIELNQGATYSTRFDRRNKTLIIRFTDVRTPKFVTELEYSDNLIDSIVASRDKATGDSIFEVVFKVSDIIFYRGGRTGRKRTDVRFSQRNKKHKNHRHDQCRVC